MAPTACGRDAAMPCGVVVIDPVAGTLVGLDTDEVVIRRHDERAGTLHVHFPRIGFQIRKDSRT